MLIEVSRLKPHPKNEEIYQISDVDDLAASIAEVGLLNALVVDQHDQVISGNRRLEAIKQLGWKTVEVDFVDVEQKTVERLIVHHNKQRIKTHRELLNEYHALERVYRQGRGKRSDLDNGRRGTTRKLVADEMGMHERMLAQWGVR